MSVMMITYVLLIRVRIISVCFCLFLVVVRVPMIVMMVIRVLLIVVMVICVFLCLLWDVVW